MKGNYPNPTLLCPSISLHPPPPPFFEFQLLFTSFISGYSSYSLHDSTCTSFSILCFFLIMLSSSSVPFVPPFLTLLLLSVCLYIQSPLTCQYTFFFIPHTVSFILLFFICALLMAAINWTTVTKALYEWERLHTSYVYFAVSANCVLVIQLCCWKLTLAKLEQ